MSKEQTWTMIKVFKTTREALKNLKLVPRESYNDVLKRLIEKSEVKGK